MGDDLKKLAAVTINSKKSTEMFASTLDGTIYVSADCRNEMEKQQ